MHVMEVESRPSHPPQTTPYSRPSTAFAPRQFLSGLPLIFFLARPARRTLQLLRSGRYGYSCALFHPPITADGAEIRTNVRGSECVAHVNGQPATKAQEEEYFLHGSRRVRHGRDL